MDVPLRKVTARVDLNSSARPQPRSRPTSPTKQSPTSLSPPSSRPKAKVSSKPTVRKLSSSSSLSTSHVSVPTPSRPASPLKPSWMSVNGTGSSNAPKARVMAKPTSRAGMSPILTNPSSLEPRQRTLTAASAKLKLPLSEDRPRSGSVIGLHHALSISDLNAPSSPALSQPSPSIEPSFVDISRSTALPSAPIKIKSKVTGLVKSAPTNGRDAASRSLSPPYATTRPIHARSRAPSITSLSLNDPPPTPFYPITTASPAANPHRYAPRRAPSPARVYPSPTLSSEPRPTRKWPLAPKVDPASVPLPPHSPPISALSLSSKSSVSRGSVSLNSDQTADFATSNVISHSVRAAERIDLSNPFLPQIEMMPRARRDRSRSKDRSPRDRVQSDVESEDSERQLRAEAKTNRKIEDLEITNRSLLAINASLETSKNRQAKEIRDLRRKLRESRLILPPQTYKAVKSADEIDDDDDDDDDDSDMEEEGADETFQRVNNLIDTLIESGKRALEMRFEDFRAGLGTKVLNADELRSWRDSGQRTSARDSHIDRQDGDDETIHTRLSPALVAVPDSDSTSSVESDEELDSDSLGSSALPPITITHSS